MNVNQPSPVNPTNKLTAAVAGTFAWNISRVVVTNLWPEYGDIDLWAAALPVFVWAFGYVVKDAANV